MDNLTHSLAGALLGQMGLKRLTGRAMATLVIAANIPDLDAIATVLGTESLAVRRGITHGPPAMLLLPPLLTALVLAWDRWRPVASGPPVRPLALLLLAYLGTLTHPALDWLNSYGVRFLEPFSSRWFYGDTLFIIDLWIWMALGAGLILSRRRERAGRSDWRLPALTAGGAIILYIAANGLITADAEAATNDQLDRRAVRSRQVVAAPAPLAFWNRQILWRSTGVYGDGSYRLGQGVSLGSTRPTRLDDARLAAVRDRPDVAAFLFWSRMPVVVERGGHAYLGDQRFLSRLTRANFFIPLDNAGPAP